jgi:hypothetical protein
MFPPLSLLISSCSILLAQINKSLSSLHRAYIVGRTKCSGCPSLKSTNRCRENSKVAAHRPDVAY